MHKSAKAIADEIEGLWETADREGRALTTDERQHVSSLIDEAESRHEVEQKMAEFGGNAGPVWSDPNGGFANGGGPGDQFIRSDGWKRIADPGSRPQSWSTGAVEVSSFQTKAGTVFEGGQGAGLVPVPQVAPGIVDTLFQELTVADLLPSAQATSSQLRYVVEGTATPGAEGVAEGGEKPASDLAFSTVDEPVKKIATVLTVSDELLEDAASVQMYLNSRLSLFVQIEEERQLLRGTGTNELVGIFGRSINTYARGTVDNNAVAIFKAMIGTRGSAFLEPDFVIMSPDNWQTTRLLTDDNNQFYGGGPFSGAYGGPAAQTGVFGNTLWNKPVVLSTVVGSGTALIGSRRAATVWRRGGPTVEATNSHSDYFTHDLVALRAEQREALAVYRPVAFTQIVGLA